MQKLELVLNIDNERREKSKMTTKLRMLMDEAHVTIYDIGACIHVSPSTIYYLSIGERYITKHVEALAEFFSCDTDLMLEKQGRYWLEAKDGNGKVSVSEPVYLELRKKALVDVSFNGYFVQRVLLKEIPELSQDYLDCVEILKTLSDEEMAKAKKMLDTIFR